MAHITKPRLGESSTTAGSGPWTVAGALTAHKRFSAECSVGDTFWGNASAVDASGNETGDWVEGLMTYSAANEITLTTPYKSSNSDLAVTFGAGTIYITLIADARQIAAAPRGGTTGQALLKSGSGDYATAWTDIPLSTTANTFTKAQRGAFVALTDAATIALDLSLANQFRVQLGGSRTLGFPTNVVEGQQGVIVVRQDATGSRTLSYAWCYETAGGTALVLSTPGCSRDLIGYSVDKYNSGVVTITIATPGVVTMTAHGFDTGQRVQITTTGALPTGLTASTTYFVSKVDADSFKLCTTLANAAAGTFIATSGSQSGVHTLTGCSITLNLAKAMA